MSATTGVAPAITNETRPFWTAAAEDKLVVEQCEVCHQYIFPPRGVCRSCRSQRLQFVPVTVQGTIYSFTVNHQRWQPNLDVPYILALVEFPGFAGVRILGRLRGCSADEVHVGLKVEVAFEPGPGNVKIPSFLAAGLA
jgi:hypothetical protein